MEREGVITCPECKGRTREVMPADFCQFFYDCPTCGARLRPRPGDCCVFCSFGSAPCPSKQAELGENLGPHLEP